MARIHVGSGIEGTPGGTYLVMKIMAKSGSRNRQLCSDDRSWRGRKRDLEETATNMARYRKSQARQINLGISPQKK